jgi:hypothetical protein
VPVWGTVVITVLSVWLLASVVLAFALGRAIRLAERHRPRRRTRRRKVGSDARSMAARLPDRRPGP